MPHPPIIDVRHGDLPIHTGSVDDGLIQESWAAYTTCFVVHSNSRYDSPPTSPRLAATDPQLPLHLCDFATELTGLLLLRIYWYDGTSGVMTSQQIDLAKCHNCQHRAKVAQTHRMKMAHFGGGDEPQGIGASQRLLHLG